MKGGSIILTDPVLINMRSYVNALEILSEKFVMIDRQTEKVCEKIF
jgi:hypothetical protein